MIAIGGPVPSGEPLGLLTDCHRRIEAAIEVLEAAAAWSGPLDEERREALSRALRFFREMAPKHTADEERSLFPRLRAKGEELPELAALEADHATADAWHAALDRIGCAWLASGARETAEGEAFAAHVADLAALYRRHIAVEDDIVFPLARRILSRVEQQEVQREMVGRRAIRLGALAALCLLLAAAPLAAEEKIGPVTVQGSIRTRVEGWNWFSSGEGENDYVFSGSFARLAFSESRKRFDWQLEFAAPILLGLPGNALAAAPAGFLGLGGNYYAANDRERNTGMVFLKQGFVRIKGLGGDERQSLKLGRFEFNDGTEVTSKDATLAALKRDRISQRLIGNFGWTHVQRSLDGFHYVANRKVALHVIGAFPTRGVFQVDGWGPLRTGFVYVSLNRAQGPSDWRLFGIYYHDFRRVLKTDNRPLAARRNDLGNIRIGTYGGHYLHTLPAKPSGTYDFLLWGAAQTGRWGSLQHLAGALAAEAGWQPVWGKRWKPWFRGGFYRGSGDGDPADGRHGTFFQLLPTPRPFARFPFFNMMNNEDAYASAAVRPSKAITVRSEFHALRLASGADQWLQGGGAFQPWTFGYVGRPSPVASGRPALANLYDVSFEWNVNARFAWNAYFGHAQGLRVVRAIYPKSQNANLGYLEATLRF